MAAVVQVWRSQARVLEARFGGSSMLPTFAPGAELRFACGSPVDVGDVAVLLHNGRVLVHRVVARWSRGRPLTRGDGTWVPDPPDSGDELVGRVSHLRQDGRWIVTPSAPDSRWRRAVVRACVQSLGISEAFGRTLISTLWYGRYWLKLAPAAVFRRLARGRSAARDEDHDADRPQP